MSVFICYSHQDKEFVDELAFELVKAKANVWLDRWELRVGESLMDRIQTAIGHADALVVVLTPSSVASEWCRRELNAAMMRELEEARVLVLPVLAKDCQIPLFLRDKLHADFRTSFNDGLDQVLVALAPATSTTLGREGDEDDHVDYALDWTTGDNRFLLRLTIVQASRANPYTVISEVSILANDALTRRYEEYEEAGLDWVGRRVVLELLHGAEDFRDLRVLIMDDLPAVQQFESYDPRTGIGANVSVMCRRLGVDTGMDILVPLGELAAGAIDAITRRIRPVTEEERARLAVILKNPPKKQ